MCMQALEKVREKHQYYASLLRLCQKRLTTDEITEISRQSRTSLVINIPSLQLKELRSFYASDFLKECENVRHIASMGSTTQDFCWKKAMAYSWKAILMLSPVLQ